MLKGSLLFEVKCELTESFYSIEKRKRKTQLKKNVCRYLPLTPRQISEHQSEWQPDKNLTFIKVFLIAAPHFSSKSVDLSRVLEWTS